MFGCGDVMVMRKQRDSALLDTLAILWWWDISTMRRLNDETSWWYNLTWQWLDNKVVRDLLDFATWWQSDDTTWVGDEMSEWQGEETLGNDLTTRWQANFWTLWVDGKVMTQLDSAMKWLNDKVGRQLGWNESMTRWGDTWQWLDNKVVKELLVLMSWSQSDDTTRLGNEMTQWQGEDTTWHLVIRATTLFLYGTYKTIVWIITVFICWKCLT